jgi:hypothetical protein
MSGLIKNHQTFFINSRSRITGSDYDFTYELPVNPAVDYTHVSVLGASIPKSFYAVQKGRSSFVLIENATRVTITMTPGNYSRASFAQELKKKLNLASTQGWLYNVTYPNISRSVDTGKYTISVTGNGGIQPILEVGEHIYERIGFNKNDVVIFNNDSIESSNVVSLNPEENLIIHSDMVRGSNSHLKAILSAGFDSYQHIIYECKETVSTSKHLNRSKSNVYNFSLTDSSDNPIDLNGLPMVIIIIMFSLRDDDVMPQF